MRKLFFSLAVVLSATTAAAAEGAKLGIGAAFGGGQAVISVPYNLAANLRLQPFVGFTRLKVTDSTDPAGDVITTDSTFTLGVGAYYVKAVGANVELYGGGRIGLDLAATKTKDEVAGTSSSDSFWGYGLAAVGGAEYYFSPRFALGVEAELAFHTVETATDVRETTIDTASFVTAKVFFK